MKLQCLVVVFLSLSAGLVQAYPAHARLAVDAYGKRVSCELCHGYGGGTERTSYGKAWHQAGETVDAFRALNKKDSDGDGANNETEIAAGSNPGDAKSTPAQPGRYATRAEKVFVPKDQLELVMPRMQRVDVVEPTLTTAQVSAIEQAIGRTLSPAERLVTLYFGVQDNKRTAVSVFAYAEYRKRHYTMLVALNTDGVIQRAAMFRGGDDAAAFRPYLDCLVGKRKDDLAFGKTVACVAMGNKQQAEVKAISSAVDAALTTIAVVFSP